MINRRTRKVIKRCSLRDNQTRKFITKHTDSAINQLSEVRYTQVDDTTCLMLKYYMVQNCNPIIAYYSLALVDLIYRAAMDKSKIYEHLTPRPKYVLYLKSTKHRTMLAMPLLNSFYIFFELGSSLLI